MIFATDLDNTMIFSHRLVEGIENQLCCVEYYNQKPLTYMSYGSIEILKKLIEQIIVIPVTTRSFAQFQRVGIFPTCKYAIVDNGGIILENGNINLLWKEHVNEILKDYDLPGTLEFLSRLFGSSLKAKIVDGIFIFAKCDDPNACKKVFECEFSADNWTLSFHRNKVYIIPKRITKGNALKFVCETLIRDNHSVITAGDSDLDLSMLEYASYGIIPSDSVLVSKNSNFIKVDTKSCLSDKILEVADFFSHSDINFT